MWWLAVGALAADLPTFQPTVAQLDNGLTVIVEPQQRTDEVAIYLRYAVGSRDERAGERGLAHLFEHLMFEGSANVPRDQFDRWLTAAGGWNNAWTSDDETVYHEVVPSGALDLALFLESDRMGFLDAGLDQANLDNQRDVVLQERATGYDAPFGRVFDALQTLAFGAAHPYAVPTIGTVADLEGAQLDGVRAFWDRHYLPRNAVLVIVGNVEPEVTLQRVAHWFSDVPDRGVPPKPARVPPDHRFTPRDGRLADDVSDRTVVLAWPAPGTTSPDAHALDVLASLLSGGRGTRIDDRLYYRSRLAQDAGAGTGGGRLDGFLYAYATSDHTPLPRLARALDAEVARLARRAPSQAEVDRAIRAQVNGLLDATERVTDRAELLLACWEQYGEADCLAREIAAARAVTPDDVHRVARAVHHPTRRATLSIVPRDDDGALPGAVDVELP